MAESFVMSSGWRSRSEQARAEMPTVILSQPDCFESLRGVLEHSAGLNCVITERFDPQAENLLFLLWRFFRNHAVFVVADPEDNSGAGSILPVLSGLWPRFGVIRSAAEAGGPAVPSTARPFRRAALNNGLEVLWSDRGQALPMACAAKRGLDILGSLLGFVLLWPLFAVIALCCLLAGTPVIYRQQRIGRLGRPFTCYKFRTMVVDAEERLQEVLDRDPEARREWADNYKLKRDPRITRFGRLLRVTSLDELPQLWNVLLGDMSLVGPRPIVRDELRYYGPEAATYLSVRPGLTGAWQVSGRNDVSYPERVALDRRYVMTWSLWRDLWILLRTPAALFWRRGAY